jgi:vacuolar-type H+-ATPase subunit E/Vma4
MALPNFSQIKQINDLLKQIEDLEAKVESKKQKLDAVVTDLDKKIKTEESREETQIKQSMLLKAIEAEIIELKELEKKLISSLNEEIDSKINSFFESGGFANFVSNLYAELNKNQGVQIQASQDTKSYSPSQDNVEELEGSNKLRLKLNKKTYILDIDKVKLKLKEKVFKTKIPERAA